MTATVKTVVGTGEPGCSEHEINNPFGLTMWVNPDVLFFCEVGNQRLRWLNLKTGSVQDVAGSGEKGYAGDGGRATDAAMNMPHEVCLDPRGDIFVVERDSHAVRRIDRLKGIITTVTGTGEAGFSGDGGPATRAQLRQPHSIAFGPGGDLLICDIGNHRIRRLNLTTGIIDTYAGTGDREPTPDGAPIQGTPLNGPRTIVVGPDGSLYLALREGNAIYRLNPATQRIEHLAGTGAQGYAGDGGPAREATLAGPKGLAYSSGGGPSGTLYVADTENHAIRAIDLASRIIRTVLGTGQRGDGPEPDPLACSLARPHGLWATADGSLYVADSEAHRIRVLTSES
jgi:DNA-binding beta-propeller fold protein YncE